MTLYIVAAISSRGSHHEINVWKQLPLAQQNFDHMKNMKIYDSVYLSVVMEKRD